MSSLDFGDVTSLVTIAVIGIAMVGIGAALVPYITNTITGSTVSTLDDLLDVNAPNPSDNQALTWDAATNKWIPETLSGGGGATTINDLNDVTSINPVDYQYLIYNGTTSKWENTFGYDIVNIKEYGAIPDDSNDDTNAFVNAITDTLSNSQIIYVPNGTYDLTTVEIITSAADKITIIGESRDVILRSSANDYILKIQPDPNCTGSGGASPCEGAAVELRNLIFYNNNQAPSDAPKGLLLNYTTTSIIKNVWFGGPYATINSGQLNAAGSNAMPQPNSTAIAILGRANELQTLEHILVAGWDIGYKLTADHLVCLNCQARQIRNTAFWLGEGAFDQIFINPHVFQIMYEDNRYSGMFFFDDKPGAVYIYSPHIEDAPSDTWDDGSNNNSIQQAPFIHLDSSASGFDSDVIQPRIYSIGGRYSCGSTDLDDTCQVVVSQFPSWANGVNVKQMNTNAATFEFYANSSNTAWLTINANEVINVDTPGSTGSIRVKNYAGDPDLMGQYKVFIANYSRVSSALSSTSVTVFSQNINRNYYPLIEFEADVELITTAPVVNQTITLELLYNGQVVDDIQVRPLPNAGTLQIILKGLEDGISSTVALEVRASAASADSNLTIAVDKVRINGIL